MGAIQDTPQITQDGQESGLRLLEITYGGKEAPFGGIDSSAAPPYIDPRCFVNSSGVLVVDNKIVTASWQPYSHPVLFSSTVGVKLLGFGTFYSSLTGQLNYALGYQAIPFAGPPSGVNYIFYITSWNPANIAVFYDDVIDISLIDAFTPPVNASLTLGGIATNIASASGASGAVADITAVDTNGSITALSITGGSGYSVGQYLALYQSGSGTSPLGPAIYQVATLGGGGSVATVTAISVGENYIPGTATTQVVAEGAMGVTISGPGGTNSYQANSVNTNGYSVSAAIALLVTLINEGPDPNVTAAASVDGNSLILTSLVPGVVGNTITVVDDSNNTTGALPPPFYFSNKVATDLQGGADAIGANALRSFDSPASITEVGGVLYIGNIGPMILKYSGPGKFTISTVYNGVSVLRKFAGSLLGLGLISQLGTVTEDQDMILAWTVAEELDIWAPLDSQGNATGAGFEQIADIGDYLSGLIVTNSIAFILRAQGVSYAYATKNSALPYDINHIGLADQGEGSQLPALITQYDQTGLFVGNSDIFQISSSYNSIGTKIKAALFTALAESMGFLGSVAVSINIGADQYPLALFAIGNQIFAYNTSNQTWTNLPIAANVSDLTYLGLGVFSSLNNFANASLFNQQVPVLVVDTGSGYDFYVLTEQVPTSTSGSAQISAAFPVEEIAFGRDITVNGLHLNIAGTAGLVITFGIYAEGVLIKSNTLTLPAGASYDQFAEYNLTFPGGNLVTKSPQLVISVANIAGNKQLQISKVMEFASFEPSEKPVL